MVQKNPVSELQKMLLLSIVLIILTYLIFDILYGYMRRQKIKELFRSSERSRNRDSTITLLIRDHVDPDAVINTVLNNNIITGNLFYGQGTSISNP